MKEKMLAIARELFILVGVVEILTTIEEFIAKEKFIVDKSEKAKVKISSLSGSFQMKFLSKREMVKPRNMYYYKLKKWAFSLKVISALGGRSKAESFLYELFSLMEKQGNGEKGVLLTDGCANVFFIRDISFELRAVECRWRNGGWHLDDNDINDFIEWYPGHQIFCYDAIEL
jgi:hypothetical protein